MKKTYITVDRVLWYPADIQQNTFMLKVIGQFMDKGSLKISDITMPGRTTKSLTHQWAKIRGEIKAINANTTNAAGPNVPPAEVKKRKKEDNGKQSFKSEGTSNDRASGDDDVPAKKARKG